MTRKEIQKHYLVRQGIIRSPVRFEGEPQYVPYFWDLYLNGADDGLAPDGQTIRFEVTAEDKREFPELRRRQVVKIKTDDRGFICEVKQ